jgi:hypothetical protein
MLGLCCVNNRHLRCRGLLGTKLMRQVSGIALSGSFSSLAL